MIWKYSSQVRDVPLIGCDPCVGVIGRAPAANRDQASPGTESDRSCGSVSCFTGSVYGPEWLTATVAANPLGAVNHDSRHSRPAVLTSAVLDTSAYGGPEWRVTVGCERRGAVYFNTCSADNTDDLNKENLP